MAATVFFLGAFDAAFFAGLLAAFFGAAFFDAAFFAATFFFGEVFFAVDLFADPPFFLAGFALLEPRLAFACLAGFFFLLVAIAPSSSVTELAATAATI
ncbi:hypothetical protein [Nitrospira sp. Nam74]